MTPLDPNHGHQALAGPLAHPAASDGQIVAAHPPLYGAMGLGGESPAGPPGLSAAPTVGGLVHALRRRWLLATSAAALAAIIAVAAVFVLMPPRYIAEVRFNVAAAPETGLMVQNQDPHVEFIVFKEYEKALVRSPLVLAAALNEMVAGGHEARDLPIVRAQANGILGWMERSLKADFKVAPEIMSAWLAGDDPDGLAELLNAIGAAFVKENDEKEKSRRKDRLAFYRENLKVKEQELSNLRSKLDAKRQPGEIHDRLVKERKLAQAQQDLAACKVLLQNLQSRQGEADLELADLQAREKNLPTGAVPSEQLDDYLRADPKTQGLIKQLEESDLKILDYPDKFKGAALESLLRKEEDRRATIETQLQQRRKLILPEIEARYRARLRSDLAEKLSAAERRRTFMAAQIKGMREEAERLGILIASLDPAGLNEPPDLLHLRDEIKSNEAAVGKIRETILLLSVEGAGGRVSMQMRASPPTDKDFSRQTKLAGAGGMSAFGFVLFAIAFWEFRARRISGTDEVTRGLGLNIVGALPAMSARARAPATATTGPRELALQAQLQEAVDGVRTMLLHAARTEPLRIIMVTSANGGEGKTSVASQLAASLARSWRKTLLIDGDLRNPATHKLFDLPREPGLCEVLRGEVAVEDAIRPAPVSRLWVLPAGHWDSHAIQALAQDNVHTLFEQLKAQYDFIIVDSCPVLPVTDALLLGQHVDGVLFSILRDVSRTPEVFAAQQRLAPLGIRTLGAVAVGMANDLGSRAYQYSGS